MARGTREAPPSRADVEAARWFYQNSLDLFVVLHDGLITRINPAWTTVTGWSAEESIGRSFREMLHPDDDDTVRDVLRALGDEGQTRAEHRLIGKDRRWIWVSSRVKRAEDGGLLVVLQDVSEEHHRAAEREQSQHASELLRAAAAVYMWRYCPTLDQHVVDPDLSKPAIAGGGGSRVLSGAEMSAEIHPDDRQVVNEAFIHTVGSGEQCVIEYRHLDPETGGYRRFRAAWLGARREANGMYEILGMTQDITELAEARDSAVRGERAATMAAEAKAQFLANMSHEIRTPMNGVLGVLHLLKSEALSAEGRRLLDEALGCGAMLAELLNDVIDFSKIEAGRLELSPEPVNPAALLESVAGLLRPQAVERGLYLTVSAPDTAVWAAIDPVRLRQMLFNLIGNAVKFTAKGGVETRITLIGKGAGQRLRIDVEDTGVGIPEAVQDQIFQRFHQGDGSTTRQFGGSGLGLAITRRLAELMGGEVGFTSAPLIGSCFWIEISAPEAQAATVTDEDNSGLLDGLRVLVVEDNATNRLIATKMLENLGASVVTADDGLQGVQAMQCEIFDIVFMDVQMPVMDGVEATRRIRALPAPACQAPILAMTANALSHQIDGYRAAGMNGSVSKPLSPASLVAAIVALVESRDDDAAAA
ncbi:MAG: hybrid sensor histidine kinase/response regulator [Caulobacter sp.]|nr:hybrid sensor histidine kinase/response regulator [Caulobacter sp.]